MIRNKSIFDSSIFYILVTIITVIFILIGFVFKIYHHQYDKTMYRLESDAARIDRTFVDTLDHTAEIMKMITAQIATNYEDKNYIQTILSRYKANPNVFNVLAWTVFSWVNSDNRIIIDGIYGILPEPIDISDRDYLKQAHIKPNTFLLGDVVVGSTSKTVMIPAGVGATDYHGKYIGSITIGFDVIKLAEKLSKSTKSEEIKFILFDKNDKVIFPYDDHEFIVKRGVQLIKENETFLKTGKLYSKVSSLIKGNNYFFIKLSKYPYVLCVYFDKAMMKHALWEGITSRVIELSLIGIVASLLIFFIYKREVFLRRQAEMSREIAISASKAKSDFLAFTAHELRTPLGFIVTGSEIVKSQLFGKLPEKYLEYITNIHQSAIELLELINDLLDEMRVERGKFKINNKILDINDIFNKVYNQNLAKSQKLSIKIKIIIQPSLPKLISDSRRLVQVFNNLVSNSIKYSPADTTIQLIAKMMDHHLMLCVIDQGFGMSKEDIEIAFSQYGTIKNTNSHKVESVGLGLPLVKMLVTELGGNIIVESHKDIGTRIIITFPAARLHYQN